MRRHPALTLCGLALGLIGPAATAGPDPNAAISIESQWRNETLKKPIRLCVSGRLRFVM